ncbi:hypothetical protein D1AOALGA4SA_977 [Olavius algarvensis Delta 1 endosymbiont]|nr:hypothetical protein D1AOALGA4SA_977 [Olavius algarvensis Delta 1 endosymbiont]
MKIEVNCQAAIPNNKNQTTNIKQITITEIQNTKPRTHPK